MKSTFRPLAFVCTLALAGPVLAAPARPSSAPPPPASPPAEVKWDRSLPYDLAKEAAEAALACGQAKGTNPSVGIMTPSGSLKILLVPDNATWIGQQVLIKKMYAAVMLQKETAQVVKQTTAPAFAETDAVSQVLKMVEPGKAVISPGGLPIFAGDDFVGVIGVGGANGDVDANCPIAGIDKIRDRLN